MNYFLHRIQKDNGSFTKGIEVHENLNDAIRSFWGRMKTAYNNPQHPDMTFVSCKITNENGNVVGVYDRTWLKEQEENNLFFFHHIRIDGETVSKDIDVLGSYDSAMIAFATQMEYGYNNPRFENVSLVSCEITDMLSNGRVLMTEAWVKPAEKPVEEPEE